MKSTVWKIAPGNHAENWGLFSQLECIAIGWLEGQDLLAFDGVEAILAALESHHGKDVPGFGKGAAEMIYSFAHEVRVADVVVANDAYNRCVGIGIIKSDYLPPKSPENPLHKDESTHRHHARMVDWLIVEPVDIPGGRLFAQKTLAQLDEEKCGKIVKAYSASYSDDKRLVQVVDALLGGKSSESTTTASDIDDVPAERAETSVYRILRDTALARRVKVLHNFECQICGSTILLPGGSRYAEAHHVKPLGRPHNGPDVMDNIICLCPNHHAGCDLGVISLRQTDLTKAKGHAIAQQFVDYHNREIHQHV